MSVILESSYEFLKMRVDTFSQYLEAEIKEAQDINDIIKFRSKVERMPTRLTNYLEREPYTQEWMGKEITSEEITSSNGYSENVSKYLNGVQLRLVERKAMLDSKWGEIHSLGKISAQKEMDKLHRLSVVMTRTEHKVQKRLTDIFILSQV